MQRARSPRPPLVAMAAAILKLARSSCRLRASVDTTSKASQHIKPFHKTCALLAFAVGLANLPRPFLSDPRLPPTRSFMLRFMLLIARIQVSGPASSRCGMFNTL